MIGVVCGEDVMWCFVRYRVVFVVERRVRSRRRG